MIISLVCSCRKPVIFESKSAFYLFLLVWGKYSYLQHVVQVERCVKHRAELHTKEARRTRMQELSNLLTNFALCFDRAHKEKRLSIQNRQHNSFQGRVGGLGTNGPMSWAAVGFPSGLHRARWRLQGLGQTDTAHAHGTTEQLLCKPFFFFFPF